MYVTSLDDTLTGSESRARKTARIYPYTHSRVRHPEREESEMPSYYNIKHTLPDMQRSAISHW